MCGIVAATAHRNIVPILLEGLHRLEYRGYDSAGVAVWAGSNGQQAIDVCRRVGKVSALEAAIEQDGLNGHSGIAHTRWATHGGPSERNAHPHASGQRLAVVHNGIIENHDTLKYQLTQAGYHFQSDTDTEVIAHLIDHLWPAGSDLADFKTAFAQAVSQLEGAFAIAVLLAEAPQHIYAARMGAPLVIGLGKRTEENNQEHYLASDPLALLQVTDQFIHLDNGDLAELSAEAVHLFNAQGETLQREPEHYAYGDQVADKGSFEHFMLKEIHEQPKAVADSLEDKLGHRRILIEALGPEASEWLAATEHVQIIACGTSYHAGLVARYWLERIAKIPCSVEIASEYRYRDAAVPKNTLFVCISQSGETADTLAALRHAKARSDQPLLKTLALCNMPGATLVRETDLRLLTQAGVEVGVASTKAFTTQLAVLYWLCLALAKAHNQLSEADEQAAVQELKALPRVLHKAVAQGPLIKPLAEDFADKHHALFLGRGMHYPIAMEGALKLKEISYIHAEAYAAGELKHGPLALVDEDMPVVAVFPEDPLLDKLKSNLEEVKARGGKLYSFVDESVTLSEQDSARSLKVQGMTRDLSPIIATIPLQLLAYHVALVKGTDVDRPRNLAKSVTVE